MTGVIYGDPNEQNLIVQRKSDSNDPQSYKLAGLIDWQHCHCAPIIFDLAIFCMYTMSSYKTSWSKYLKEMSTPKPCVEGFLSEWRLPDAEVRLLPLLIASRFAQSLCLGAYSYYELDPTNDYLLTTAQNGWRILRQLWEADHSILFASWAVDK